MAEDAEVDNRGYCFDCKRIGCKKFCVECGEKLLPMPPQCANCRAVFTLDDVHRYCGECGNELEPLEPDDVVDLTTDGVGEEEAEDGAIFIDGDAAEAEDHAGVEVIPEEEVQLTWWQRFKRLLSADPGHNSL